MTKRNAAFLASLCIVFGAFLARLPATIANVNAMIGVHDPDNVDWEAAMHDVMAIIRARYVEEPDEAALYKGAIQGMTDALNDRYSEFIAPADKAAFEKDLMGQFVGIGASVIVRDGWLTIAYPLEDSPAYRAGLRPGDQVRAINGTTTANKRVDECVKLLLGEPDTKVMLTIAREGMAEGESIEVPITRAPIAARSVRGVRFDHQREDWDYVLDAQKGIAYIRVDQFTPGVAAEFIQALRTVGSATSLIIDLRDNPGGLMDQAIQIVDLFLDKGTIVSTRGRRDEGETYEARKGAISDLPLVVLVNEGSASASEIVAGALSDNKRAIVIGTRTFGKGLVQRVEQLPNVPGAQLKLTEQHYYLPSGRMIHRTDKSKEWGVDPDAGFYVPLTDEQQRAVWLLRREMETIRPPVTENGQRIPAPVPTRDRELSEKVRGQSTAWNNPDWIEGTAQDAQLAAAVRAVQGRLASGQWTPTGKPAPDQSVAIASVELSRLERERDNLDRFMARLDERIAALAEGGGRVGAAALSRPTDLWTDTTDLTGGRLEVFDKSGKRIALLNITGPDVERWLVDADVKPVSPAPGEASAPAAPASTGEQKPPATGPSPAPEPK